MDFHVFKINHKFFLALMSWIQIFYFLTFKFTKTKIIFENIVYFYFGRVFKQKSKKCGFRPFSGSRPDLKVYSGQAKIYISSLDIDQLFIYLVV